MKFLKYINPFYYLNNYIDNRVIKILEVLEKKQNKENAKMFNYFSKKSNSDEI